jgi:hypothetical protein
MVGSAAVWPARSVRRQAQDVDVETGPLPGVGVLGGERWLLVWGRDPLGECCCWRGTVRTGQGARAGNCTNPGKHPWVIRVDGQLYGFEHGAADALDWVDLADRYGPPGGSRQLAVVLDGLIVVDLDSERAVRDFSRVAHTVPGERILGVSSTPRGFHVWLDAPGWNQKALNQWMAQWLAPWGGWSGTDERKAGRRGFLLDVRTGANRYVVWPGQDAAGERRWVSRRDFGQVIRRYREGMPGWRLVSHGDKRDGGHAPWAVDTRDHWLAGWIAEHRGGTELDLDGLDLQGSDRELELTWRELERWLGRLEQMAAGSGRNNALNQISYYSGGRCVAAGHSVESVRQKLIEAGEGVGTHGVRDTVNSGLNAGVKAALKQVKGGTA